MVKESKIFAFAWTAFIVSFLIACLFCFLRVGDDVSDNGGGADTVRNELITAGGKLETQADAISGAIGTAETIERATGTILEIERGDAELLADCRGILERVRSRGETESGN